MTNPSNQLHDEHDFGTFGRFVETPVDEMSPGTRAAYNTTRKLREMVPGPHKIWLANPALSRAVVPTGAYFQTSSSLDKSEIEIVTDVVVGHWSSGYASYEHEKIGVRFAQLDPDTVDRLIAGIPVVFGDPRQQLVYELALTLIRPRRVPAGVYRKAKELIGDAGIADVAMLIGWFTGVALTLNAFDVPSDALGLEL